MSSPLLHQQTLLLASLLVAAPVLAAHEKVEYLRSNIPAHNTCSTKRLSNSLFAEQRKQTNSPWCYAYVSADLLSWELKEWVSAADIALTYNNIGAQRVEKNKRHSEIVDGGNPANAMAFAMETGFCMEKDMPSQNYLFSDGKYGKDVEMLTMIQGIENIQGNWNLTHDEEYFCQNTSGVREIFPWLNDLAIGEILMKANPYDVIDKMREKNCAGKRKFLKISYDAVAEVPIAKTKDEEREKLLHRLDQLLELEKPIGLAVRGKFINPKDEDPKNFHAVSVIGRKLNPQTNQCEYLIRDSNPAGCANNTYRCEANGDAWASEKLLKDNIEWLYYLREKKAP